MAVGLREVLLEIRSLRKSAEGLSMTTVPTPYCLGCAHVSQHDNICRAFPDGIPEGIWDNQIDHRMPYPGDHGILFEAIAPWGDEMIQSWFEGRPPQIEDDPLPGA